jgi:Flp pilus assembly protein TadG
MLIARIARFLKDRKAGVAPMLALGAIPLIGMVGAAVDYSRANSVRAAMQGALDSTALMLSRDAQNLNEGQLNSKATGYFNALFNRPEATNVQVTPQFSSPQQGNFKLTVSGTATMTTVFWKLVGQEQLNISAIGEVIWGIKKLNLALALDNTGSMASSNKMTELKKAAHALLDTLQKASKSPGDIKISIVPFAVDVNVGTSNVNESWIDWSHWDEENGSCSNNNYNNHDSCVSNGKKWTPKNHSTWNGCVKDRDQNNDVSNTPTGTSGGATRYRAEQANNCPTAMLPLSTDWTVLHSKIDAMTPTGNTNVTIGLQMAWQTISSVAPFSAPAASPDLDKVIILMTDGDNTENRWTKSSSSIDSRTQKACDNVKAAGVKVYTVRVIAGNATLLQNCATKPDMYFNVQNASQLNSVFSAIAQNLANLRISK